MPYVGRFGCQQQNDTDLDISKKCRRATISRQIGDDATSGCETMMDHLPCCRSGERTSWSRYMNPKKPDLEARAEALLKRIQRHNRGMDSLTELEVQSMHKEIQAIGQMNHAGFCPDDVLARVDQ